MSRRPRYKRKVYASPPRDWPAGVELIAIPGPVHAFFVADVERRWREMSGPVLAAIPETVPLSTMFVVAWGGPFGYCVEARIDEVDGRLLTAVWTENRMNGQDYFYVEPDGTVRASAFGDHYRPGLFNGATESEVEAEEEWMAYDSRVVSDYLARRGFGSVGGIAMRAFERAYREMEEAETEEAERASR